MTEPRAHPRVGTFMRATHAFLVATVLAASAAHAQTATADGGVPDASSFRALVDSNPFEDPEGTAIGAAATDPLSIREVSDLNVDASLEGRVATQAPVVGEVLTAVPGVRETSHRTHVELTAGLALVRTELHFEAAQRFASELAYRLAVPRGAVPFALEVCRGDACRTGALEPAAGFSRYDAALVASGPVSVAAPVAQLDAVRDALVVRVGPVGPASNARDHDEVTVRVAYAVPWALHGGVVRFVLPARGSDARVANDELTVHTDALVVPRIESRELDPDEVVTRSPADATHIDALVPRSHTTGGALYEAPCLALSSATSSPASPASAPSRAASSRCLWATAMAARPTPDVHDVVLALDASPSTEAGARGLLPEAAHAILAALPASARVYVVSFAARATLLAGPVAPSAVTDELLHRAVEPELGSATRFDALWSVLAPLPRSARVVWLGDGGLTTTDDGQAALRAARSARLDLAFVSVASRPSAAGLVALADALHAPRIDASAEALKVARHPSDADARDALAQALARVLVRSDGAPVELRGAAATTRAVLPPGGLVTLVAHATPRARPALHVEGTSQRPRAAEGDLALAIAALAAHAEAPPTSLRFVAAPSLAPTALACRADATWLGPTDAPRLTPSGIRLTQPRACVAATATSSSTPTERPSQLGAEALLRTMRQRILPPARDCFRSDRRGRAGYSTRVALVLTLADREVLDVRAEGPISATFRRCMVDAVQGLEVPPFDGVIVARWPLRSEPELPPPTLALEPTLAAAIDHLASDEAAP